MRNFLYLCSANYVRMRRYLYIIGLILGCCLSVMADPTATLLHNGQSTFFLGTDGFKRAYAASVEGDSILIYGTQYFGDTIRKTIRIIGGGYSATTDLYPENDSIARVRRYPCVQADHVTFESIYFSEVRLLNTNYCTFKHCYISYLDSVPGMGHSHTLVDQCRLMNDESAARADHYTIQNSYINRLYALNSPDHLMTITNCMLRYYYERCDSTYYYFGRYKQPYAIYRHNVLCLDAYAEDSPEHPFLGDLNFEFKAPSQYYDNYIYRLNSSYSADPSYYIHYTFEPECVNENNTVNLTDASAVWCDSTHSYYDWLPECYGGIDYDYPLGPMQGIEYSRYATIPQVVTFGGYYTDYEGQLSTYIRVTAKRRTPTDNPSVAQIEWWVDDPIGQEKNIILIDERPGANDTVSVYCSFDFGALPAGSHILYYRLKDTNGTYGPLLYRIFTRRNPYDYELFLPYDATSLEGDMQTANPTYMAYPTEQESIMPIPQCN